MPPSRRSRAIALGIAAVLILVGAILVLRSARASDLSLSRVKRAGFVVVGLDPSYPPFEVVNGEGQLDGYDVELSRELARRLGVHARLVAIDFGGIYDALDVGKFDVIVGGVTPLPGDDQNVRYTHPYYDD